MNKKKKFSLFIAIISFIIFLIHCINKLIFFLSIMKERLYSENGNIYNWRFGKIFYTKKGSGLPLLLIHDLNCTSSDYEWKSVVSKLSESYTVYTIDLIGCGRSDKPKITYTNYLYVQLISDFIKNIIKHKVNVMATGKSSAAVIMSCYNDSNLFNNIILINPENLASMNKYPKIKNKIFKYLFDCPILGTFFYNMIVSKNIVKEDFEERYFYNKNNIRSKYVETYIEAAHTGGSSAKFLYSSIACRYTNINIIHALKEINNCIYLIGGEYEEKILEIFDDYIELNPSIETEIIEKTKHLPQLEKPEDIINLCKLYLN